MFKKQNLLLLLGVFTAIELTSFLTIDNRIASGVVAVVLTLLAAVFTWKNLYYGVYALLTELILGSKGYLFSLTIGGMRISLRMFLFCAVLGVWFLVFLIRNKKFAHLRQLFGALWWPYIALLGAVAYGIILGVIYKNSMDAIFLDVNAFGYLLLAPVFLEGLKLDEHKKRAIQILLVAAFWLAVKTIILFVLFSYFGREQMDYLYRWVRNSGVGEVTWLASVRVFLQSQIFIVVAWLYILFSNFGEKTKKVAPILILFGGAILISLSRSFFVGMLAAVMLGCIYLIHQKKFVDFKIIAVRMSVSLLGAYLLVLLLNGSLFAPQNRFTADAGESSRRNQLPVLLLAIKQNPLGYGFGKTLTYQTTDPRALATNLSGQYTTYSFELGWLDFILKVGLLGTLIYVWFLFGILKRVWPKIEFMLPLLALIVIHFLTPYLNHPLGIGLLLFIATQGIDIIKKPPYS